MVNLLLIPRFRVRLPARAPTCFVGSAARRQNAFGCRATDLRLIRYTYFGTFATLPGHEGDAAERVLTHRTYPRQAV
jgi:hypothetical protein